MKRLITKEAIADQRQDADVTSHDDGVILFLTAHTKRGQQWLNCSTGMHFGAGFVFERDSLIDLTQAMAALGFIVN